MLLLLLLLLLLLVPSFCLALQTHRHSKKKLTAKNGIHIYITWVGIPNIQTKAYGIVKSITPNAKKTHCKLATLVLSPNNFGVFMTFDLSIASHLCKLHIYASQLLSFPNLTNSKLLHQEKYEKITTTTKKKSLTNERDEDCKMKKKNQIANKEERREWT